VKRVRIRYAKQGDLRFISHRDLMRAFERMMKRAGLVVVMSEGFHPRPRLRFPAALALGLEGVDEVMEVDLVDEIAPEALLAKLNAHAPSGLSFHGAQPIAEGVQNARASTLSFELPLPAGRAADAERGIESFLAASAHLVDRGDGKPSVDIRPLIEDMRIEDGVLRMTLRVSERAGVRPRDALAAIGLADLESRGILPKRTRVELVNGTAPSGAANP